MPHNEKAERGTKKVSGKEIPEHTETSGENEQEEQFSIQLTNKVKEVLAYRETPDGTSFDMSVDELYKSIAMLALEDEILVLDEKKNDKRIINVTMEMAQKALLHLREFYKTRPVSEGDAFEAIQKIKGKVLDCRDHHEGLLADKVDSLIKKAGITFMDISAEEEEENQDYRPVLNLALKAGIELSIAFSNHLFVAVNTGLEKVQELKEFSGDFLRKLKERIEKSERILNQNKRQEAAHNHQEELNRILFSSRVFVEIDGLFKEVQELQDFSDDSCCKFEERIKAGKNLTDSIARRDTACRIKRQLIKILNISDPKNTSFNGPHKRESS